MIHRPKLEPWQERFLELFDKPREAGSRSKVKLIIGRKRGYLIVTDKDGRPVE